MGSLSRAPGLDAAEAIEERLQGAGVVPVVELPEADLAVPLADALVAGGLSCVEITFRTPAAREGLAAIREAHPEILLGAGTVLDVEQVEAAVEAGADFAVAPGTSPEIVRAAHERGLPMLPGTCTPSDVEPARRLGSAVAEVLPGRADRRRRVSASPLWPLPGRPLRPDRVDHARRRSPSYLAIPQVVACGGSWMVKPELLRAGEWGRVTELAAEAAALAAAAR